jgi:plastocyanin
MSKTFFSAKTGIIAVCVIAMTMFAISIAVSTTVLANGEQIQGQDTITIIPGSSDKNNPAFFDITYYPIQVGKELRWYNADDINHKIVISSGNETTPAGIENKKVIESGDIKPKTSFTYKFDKEGTYRFSSPTFPWMHGNIIASNNISTTAVTNNLNNSVAIQLTWFPSKPKVAVGPEGQEEQQTHFIIKFINEKTNKIQEHIDYRLVIYDQSNKSVFEQGLHSGWGVEQAAYKFMATGNYRAEVTINYILFAPVTPDTAKFSIVVTK